LLTSGSSSESPIFVFVKMNKTPKPVAEGGAPSDGAPGPKAQGGATQLGAKPHQGGGAGTVPNTGTKQGKGNRSRNNSFGEGKPKVRVGNKKHWVPVPAKSVPVVFKSFDTGIGLFSAVCTVLHYSGIGPAYD